MGRPARALRSGAGVCIDSSLRHHDGTPSVIESVTSLDPMATRAVRHGSSGGCGRAEARRSPLGSRGPAVERRERRGRGTGPARSARRPARGSRAERHRTAPPCSNAPRVAVAWGDLGGTTATRRPQRTRTPDALSRAGRRLGALARATQRTYTSLGSFFPVSPPCHCQRECGPVRWRPPGGPPLSHAQ